MTTPKGGRPKTGAHWKHKHKDGSWHWDIRITLPDGTRSKPICLPNGTSEAMAIEKAKALTELAAKEALPRSKVGEAIAGESFSTWCTRWLISREERGLSSVQDDRGRLKKWVEPVLGPKPIARIQKRDIESLVEDLDTRVRAGELSWKTAINVWTVVSKAFDDAANAKKLSLRVLEINPADGVRGPDRGGHKSKAYLYPVELMTLMNCAEVPVQWRRMYAVSTYLYLRAAEARALEWADVDLERGLVLVHRTVDEDDNFETTKGMRARRFAIEPALLPLLRQMHADAEGKGRVLPRMPVEKHLAPMLRRHLELAGVDRRELFANDKTRKRLRFHDLRATGLTWMAIRGDDPLKIKQRAGHTTFSTTEGYIREAESVRDTIGSVFPEVPAGLFRQSVASERFGKNGHAYVKTDESSVGEAGFEDAAKHSRAPDPSQFEQIQPKQRPRGGHISARSLVKRQRGKAKPNALFSLRGLAALVDLAGFAAAHQGDVAAVLGG